MSNGDEVTTPGNAGPTEEQLRDLAMQLKQHIEYKEWDALEGLLTIPSVWLTDRNVPVAEAIAEIRSVLGTAADIQLTLDRVTRTSFSEDQARVSLVTHVVWSEAETWAEHEGSVELHLGFRREGDQWSFASLGFTPVAAQEPQVAAGAYFAAERADYFEGFVSGDYLATHLLGQPYFSSLASYLSAAQLYGAGAPPAPAPPQAPSHVLVYMPVFVPVDLMQQHLKKS